MEIEVWQVPSRSSIAALLSLQFFVMRLLFISLLILNLFFGAWNLEQRLSGSGSLQHSIWFVICLATAAICFLELRHQKTGRSLGLPTLESMRDFLRKAPPKERSTVATDKKAVAAGEMKEPLGRSEPEEEKLKQAA